MSYPSIVDQIESIVNGRSGLDSNFRIDRKLVYEVIFLIRARTKFSLFSLLPIELLHEILNAYCSLSLSVIVFGNHLGRAYSKTYQATAPPSNILIPSLEGSTHWNSDRQDKASIFCEFEALSYLVKIVMSIRCAKTLAIYGGTDEKKTGAFNSSVSIKYRRF